MSGSHDIPCASGPFSALTPSIWPQEILAKYTQKEESMEKPEFYYDEFGFWVDRKRVHLEFTHNHDVGGLTWDKIAASLPHSEKLLFLVLASIPHSMRPQLWMRFSGTLQKKRNSELSYQDMVKNSYNDETIAAKQIE
uniref:Uncharacterized protein n=1 Tax=Pipistrellus kuhlii TaxID=59472 RepID=A0A7J7SG69_PIPKU|nr:hypothetical protein mPipKuh1_009958 [Pipistrellus kuhlii]